MNNFPQTSSACNLVYVTFISTSFNMHARVAQQERLDVGQQVGIQ